jgi:hypothetical protein
VPPVTDCSKFGTAKANAETAAVTRAASNNYTITPNDNPGDADTNYVYVHCGVDTNHIPYMDVKIQVLKTTPTSFLQVIVPNQILTNKMSSTARLHTATSYGNGSAIVALNPSDKCSMETGAGFSGNTSVNVVGGGIFSNGCLDGKGAADVNISTGGKIYYYYNNFKAGVFDPNPTLLTNPADRLQAPVVSLQDSDCDLTGSHRVTSLPSNLTPGLWCVTGGVSGSSYTGDGVTIWIQSGTLKITGGNIHLTAPYFDSTAPGNGNPATNHAINGLLFYVPTSSKNGIDLTGNSTSYYQGSMLAPNTDIQINGGSSTDSFHSQLIGYDVKINGGSLFNITYDPNQNLGTTATIDLYQ